MSARNGDKARYHKERQGAVIRRKKREELRKALETGSKAAGTVPAVRSK